MDHRHQSGNRKCTTTCTVFLVFVPEFATDVRITVCMDMYLRTRLTPSSLARHPALASPVTGVTRRSRGSRCSRRPRVKTNHKRPHLISPREHFLTMLHPVLASALVEIHLPLPPCRPSLQPLGHRSESIILIAFAVVSVSLSFLHFSFVPCTKRMPPFAFLFVCVSFVFILLLMCLTSYVFLHVSALVSANIGLFYEGK